MSVSEKGFQKGSLSIAIFVFVAAFIPYY